MTINETGKRIRLKQEFLLVSASLQDIVREHLLAYPDMSNFADKVRIHINDTHPALVIAELQRLLVRHTRFRLGRSVGYRQDLLQLHQPHGASRVA